MQLFKGKFYYCDGPDVKNITTKADCTNAHYKWVRRKYNFDNLGQVKSSLQGFSVPAFHGCTLKMCGFRKAWSLHHRKFPNLVLQSSINGLIFALSDLRSLFRPWSFYDFIWKSLSFTLNE